MTYIDLKKTLSAWISELKQPIRLEQSSETSISPQKSERDETFDVLKGLAIIFVILAHSDTGALRTFINSFHMPLFFFIAGFFLKIRPLREEIKLSIKRLIFPYIFVSASICFSAFINDLSNYALTDGSHTQSVIITHLWGFWGESIPHWTTGHISILWFILAMFWARILCVFILKKIKSVSILCTFFFITSILGIFLTKCSFIPFCIPQGLAATGFIFTGYLIKKFRLMQISNMKLFFPILFILWLYCLNRGNLAMVSSSYPAGYIWGLLGALGAFFALDIIVKNLYRKESIIWKIVLFAGRYSLVIYCVHAIESIIINWKDFCLLHQIPLKYLASIEISARIIIAIVFTIIILKIKPLREGIFQIRTI